MKRIALICVSIFVLTNLLYPQDIINETGKDGKFIIRDIEQQDVLIVDEGDVTITGVLKVEELEEGSSGNKVVVWDTEDKKFKALYNMIPKGTIDASIMAADSWTEDGSGNIYRATGMVGIGTTTPERILDINPNVSGSAQLMRESDSDLFAINLKSLANRGELLLYKNGAITTKFTGFGSSYFTGGKVGIGNASPDEELHVTGEIRLDGAFEDKDGQRGISGQILSSTGSATDWIDASSGGGGDNLGNHTATQNVELGSNWLSGDGDVEGIFIDGSGNVGINTNTPGHFLEVASDMEIDGAIFAHDNTGVGFKDDTGNLGLWVEDGGNVGIGTLTPDEKLHVSGSLRLTGGFEDKDGQKGTSGQILSSTGTQTNWIDAPSGGGGDNLGNHTATQDLNMDGYEIGLFGGWLSGDGDNEGVSVHSNGNVSVGTNWQWKRFNVYGESVFSDDIYLRDGAVDGGDILLRMFDSSDDGVLDIYRDNSVTSRIHGNGASYITGGNFGLGINTPDEQLHVSGNMRLTGGFEDKDGQKGTSGQILSSTGTQTNWIDAPSGGGDNLGNHNATTSLDMNGYNIGLEGGWLGYDGSPGGVHVNSSGYVAINTSFHWKPFNVFGESVFSDDIYLRDGNINSGDYLARLYDSSDDGVLDIYQNNAVKIRLHGNGSSYIDNGSNFGIGITSPEELLHVDGDMRLNGAFEDENGYAGNSGQLLSSTGTGTDWIDAPSGGDNLGNHTATQDIHMNASEIALEGGYLSGDGDNEGVFVSTSGNVGVGTSSPTHPFHVEKYYNSYHNGLGHFNNTAAQDAYGVYGACASYDYYGWGGFFKGGYHGVEGNVQPTGSNTYYGVKGIVSGGSGTNHAIYGSASGSGANWAGTFEGNVQVNGTLSKGGGSFKIDHPLDPRNKYLSHSFVESPDMMNVYNGNIVTSNQGTAIVELPNYFETLNRDFRYQLTVIGEFAQAIVSQKISGNRFSIRTDKPNIEVSWQVTGIRQDAFANANRILVEEIKISDERGKFLHPELYGLDKSYSVNYVNKSQKREIK